MRPSGSLEEFLMISSLSFMSYLSIGRCYFVFEFYVCAGVKKSCDGLGRVREPGGSLNAPRNRSRLQFCFRGLPPLIRSAGMEWNNVMRIPDSISLCNFYL
jgi:hypothetical protein